MDDLPLAYLDSSAFVKLVKEEPESGALDTALDDWPCWASSTLLEVEGGRVARRADPLVFDATRVLMGGIQLIEISSPVRRAATELTDAGLRTLDAIHLATALSLGDRLGAFFAYDERLIAAARAHGLTVTVPRP